MDYNTPLIEGLFLKRYKRFFADIKIDGKVEVAHVPNTGSLKGICQELQACRVMPSSNPERKLKFTLEQLKLPSSWVGVNTHRANEIAWEAFINKQIPHWKIYNDGAREVKISAESRLDIKLSNSKGAHFVEVKSVTLAEKNLALFPDAVTTRGQKHLNELMRLKNEGATAELLFIVQREDCTQFSPAQAIDFEYTRLLIEARNAGVKITIYPATLSSDRLVLNCNQELKLLLA